MLEFAETDSKPDGVTVIEGPYAADVVAVIFVDEAWKDDDVVDAARTLVARYES